jgi:DNA-directed RNA polymerase specialized sigma24 family protein
MTTGQVPGVDDLRSAPPAACPCGRGDVSVEIAGQRPLLERAMAGDGRALGELYEDNVDDVYRYLRAWTGDDVTAKELTEQVFHGALTWLPVIAEGESDLAAWLMTMARDALVERRGAGWTGGAEQLGEQAPDVLVAAAQLDDAQREVVVLRLLLGHSLAHTAHLAGHSAQVVSGLQLAACSAIWQLLSGATVEPAPPGSQELRARWFEGCLEGAYYDPATDPGLSDLLAVADALRQAAPWQVPLPDDAFLRRLRQQLLGELGGDAPRRAGGSGPGRLGRAFALARFHAGRHPWAATIVAAGAIGLVLGVQIASNTGARSACGDQPCLASTTEATAAPQAGAAGPTLPTLSPTTILTTSTAAPTTTLPPTTRARAAVPSTAPPTTAARTTRTTRRTTTTRPPPSRPRPSTTVTTAPASSSSSTTSTTEHPAADGPRQT